jgi:SWI/SNF-related matrix-associated actin-dependent regulator 1 of chromatin subfamily A
MTTMTDLLTGIVPDAVIQGDTLDATYDLVAPAEPYEFFDYQEEALEHLFRDPAKRYGYLGLDMGLGKSLGAWALAATIRSGEHAVPRPVLFVVPPALRTNIMREGEKFYPDLKVQVITTAKPKNGEALDPTADVVVMGDSALKGKNERQGGRSVFRPEGWTAEIAGKVDAIVVDEAHRHKNNSTRSNALVHLGSMCAGYKVLMSGTPTPNGRNIEIARQIEFLGEQAWADIGGKGHFYTRYAPVVDPAFGTRESKYGEELNALMASTWYFRRLRDDVLDLPNKGRSFVGIDGEGQGKRDYLRAEKDLISYLRDEEKNHGFSARAEALVKLNTLRRLAGVARSANVAQHVREILEDSDEGGVFVVAEHSDVIDTIMMKLLKYSPTTIRGGMTDAERTEAVDAFTSGESRVLVGQITSAGTGFTLHGDGRNHRVVFAQLPWTPAEVRQAEDRLHRIGQTKDVHVELTGCVIEDAEGGSTVDERLWAALESKAFRMGQLQDGEGTYLLDAVQDSVLDSYR